MLPAVLAEIRYAVIKGERPREVARRLGLPETTCGHQYRRLRRELSARALAEALADVRVAQVELARAEGRRDWPAANVALGKLEAAVPRLAEALADATDEPGVRGPDVDDDVDVDVDDVNDEDLEDEDEPGEGDVAELLAVARAARSAPTA
jgi:hypothetical protein